VSVQFFGLALAAAINPSLLAVNLALIVNRRPRAMFLCVLLGGLTMAVAVGLVYVLVLRFSLRAGEGDLGAGTHLVLGLALLALAWALFTGRLPRRRQRKAEPEPDPALSAGTGPEAGPGHDAGAAPDDGAAARPQAEATPAQKAGWTQRMLREPRLGLGFIVGLALGTPGAIYLAALQMLVSGDSSTASEVAAVILFAIIEFALLIIPLVFLIVRPDAAAAFIRGVQRWLTRHGTRLLGCVALAAGLYLTIDAIVNLA
jgi:Sap, sulfolipid-1-addressing protein